MSHQMPSVFSESALHDLWNVLSCVILIFIIFSHIATGKKRKREVKQSHISQEALKLSLLFELHPSQSSFSDVISSITHTMVTFLPIQLQGNQNPNPGKQRTARSSVHPSTMGLEYQTHLVKPIQSMETHFFFSTLKATLSLGYFLFLLPLPSPKGFNKWQGIFFLCNSFHIKKSKSILFERAKQRILSLADNLTMCFTGHQVLFSQLN